MAELTRAEVFYGASESEPLEKPTEDLASEAPEETEELAEDETVEADELDAEAEDEIEEEGDILVHEINGKEYTAEQIQALEDGNLMQADYTKKTQSHAKDVEALTEERTLFEADKSKVSDLTAQLEVLVSEDSEIDWAELKEDDPEEYITQKEKADSRAAKLAEVKANQAQPQQQAMSEEDQKSLTDANPQWLTDGKQDANNKEFLKDMQMLVDYGSTIGMSVTELQSMHKASHWHAMLDAAKYANQKAKGSALNKKVRKAPKVTKPKAKQTNQRKSREEVFYGKQ
jgi:hypothetical protein